MIYYNLSLFAVWLNKKAPQGDVKTFLTYFLIEVKIIKNITSEHKTHSKSKLIALLLKLKLFSFQFGIVFFFILATIDTNANKCDNIFNIRAGCVGISLLIYDLLLIWYKS